MLIQVNSSGFSNPYTKSISIDDEIQPVRSLSVIYHSHDIWRSNYSPLNAISVNSLHRKEVLFFRGSCCTGRFDTFPTYTMSMCTFYCCLFEGIHLWRWCYSRYYCIINIKKQYFLMISQFGYLYDAGFSFFSIGKYV